MFRRAYFLKMYFLAGFDHFCDPLFDIFSTTFETYFAHSDNAEKAFKKEGRKEKSESVALKNTEDQK